MMNRLAIVEAVKRGEFITLPTGEVLNWVHEGNGCDDCPIWDRPDGGSICDACIDLDKMMPLGDSGHYVGSFVLVDKEAVK